MNKIAEKRQQLKVKEQAQKDMLSLVYYMKQANVGSPVDVSEKLESLGDKLSSIKVDDASAKEIKAIAEQYKNIAVLLSKYQEQHTDKLMGAIQALSDTLGAKETQITVEGKEIEIQPLVDALKEIHIEAPSIELPRGLEEYKAHDIRDDGDTQYIGFVAPGGKWYIIESKNNSMRYVFGDKDYLGAFKKAGSWDYKILSEAKDEV